MDNAYKKPAIALLRTLSSPHSTQAQLVRSLKGLVKYISLLANDELSPPFSALPHLPGARHSFAYLVNLVQICVNLQMVDLTFSTTHDFLLVQGALQGCHSTLKAVCFESVDENRIPKELVNKVLLSQTFARIEKFGWTRTSIFVDRSSPSAPSVSLPLKSLRIREDFGSLELVKQFFLVDSSSLTKFGIQLGIIETADIDYIFNSLPSTLLRLSITCLLPFTDPKFRPSLTKYLRDRMPFQTLFSGLSRFTSLQHLQLMGFQGPSLALVQTLASSSPSLVNLDFSNSYWTRAFDPSGIVKANSIFPVAEISQALAQLKLLRSVHFGYLPTRNRAKYDSFTQRLGRRGIEVRWVECRALEEA